MPKGPQGQKRPADVIGNAVRIARIATGEDEDVVADPKKSGAGKAGGAARAKAITKDKAASIAKTAAAARWTDKK